MSWQKNSGGMMIAKRLSWWEKQESCLDSITKAGAKRYLASLPSYQRYALFDHPYEQRCTCVDGRIPLAARVHLPGAGAMEPISKVVTMLSRVNIQEVLTHDDCAACTALGIDPIQWGKQVENASHGQITHRHLTATEMTVTGFHPETVVYVKAMRRFNRNNNPRLPYGFHVGVKDTPQLRRDLCLCAGIAMNRKQGMGDFFSSEIPLNIIVLGHSFSQNPRLNATNLIPVIHRILDGEPVLAKAMRERRIRIDGFNVPREWMDARYTSEPVRSLHAVPIS